MKNSSDLSLEEIKERRKRLQVEIRSLEESFGERISGIKDEIQSISTPAKKIRGKPLKSVAVAAGAGFLIGLIRRPRRKKRDVPPTNSTPPKSRTGFSSLLMNELKHLAARKAMFYISELIDRQISDLKDQSGK